ncbi:MAG: serine/threonine-protein kinase [Candidatus Xenobia bacterium]
MSVDPAGEERRTLGRYRLEQRLGAGSMGTVYLASTSDDGWFAVKVLHKRLLADTEPFRRFQREIEVMQTFKHPNICHIHDSGCDADGTTYLVMELLQGADLMATLEYHGRFTLPQAVSLTWQLLVGLQVIHEAGIVHRDLKPDNLFLSQDGSLKILDFSLAHVRATPTRATNQLTRTGTLMGTPSYVAPEQVRDAKKVLPTSDIFSVGATFYTMLTGKLPFEGGMLEVIPAVLECDGGPPLAVHRPDLPPSVEAWKARCMRQNPEHRFQSANEALEGLRALH